jgi:hypothetical protein
MNPANFVSDLFGQPHRCDIIRRPATAARSGLTDGVEHARWPKFQGAARPWKKIDGETEVFENAMRALSAHPYMPSGKTYRTAAGLE